AVDSSLSNSSCGSLSNLSGSLSGALLACVTVWLVSTHPWGSSPSRCRSCDPTACTPLTPSRLFISSNTDTAADLKVKGVLGAGSGEPKMKGGTSAPCLVGVAGGRGDVVVDFGETSF